jgi:hypothetical protein
MASTWSYSFDGWTFENAQVYGDVTAVLNGNVLTVTATMTEAYTAIYSSGGTYKFNGNVEMNMRLTVDGTTLTSAKCIDYHANGASATRSKSGYHKESMTNITVSTTLTNTTGSYPFTVALDARGTPPTWPSARGTITVDASAIRSPTTATARTARHDQPDQGGGRGPDPLGQRLYQSGLCVCGVEHRSRRSGTGYAEGSSYTADAALSLYDHLAEGGATPVCPRGRGHQAGGARLLKRRRGDPRVQAYVNVDGQIYLVE